MNIAIDNQRTITISQTINGYLITRRYIGHSQTAAKKLFKNHIKALIKVKAI